MGLEGRDDYHKCYLPPGDERPSMSCCFAFVVFAFVFDLCLGVVVAVG